MLHHSCRDIKPENILIMDDVLKLADFGSCRGIYSKQPYTEYISTRWCVECAPGTAASRPLVPITHSSWSARDPAAPAAAVAVGCHFCSVRSKPAQQSGCVSLSPDLCCPVFRRYRAPECLLTDGYYNYKMDMWGVGCVMFEIVALYPLFPGARELGCGHCRRHRPLG